MNRFNNEGVYFDMSYRNSWDKEIGKMVFETLDGAETQQKQKTLLEREQQFQAEDYDRDAYGAYLKEMARIPLLTREEEVELAKLIELKQGNVAQLVLRYPHIISEVSNPRRAKEVAAVLRENDTHFCSS